MTLLIFQVSLLHAPNHIFYLFNKDFFGKKSRSFYEVRFFEFSFVKIFDGFYQIFFIWFFDKYAGSFVYGLLESAFIDCYAWLSGSHRLHRNQPEILACCCLNDTFGMGIKVNELLVGYVRPEFDVPAGIIFKVPEIVCLAFKHAAGDNKSFFWYPVECCNLYVYFLFRHYSLHGQEVSFGFSVPEFFGLGWGGKYVRIYCSFIVSLDASLPFCRLHNYIADSFHCFIVSF